MKDDPTAWFEEIIDEVAEESRDMVERIAPSVLNREPFSTPKPPEVQHQEWVDAMQNPDLLMQRYQMLAQLYGPEKGELLLRQWDKKHAAMVNDMEQENANSVY